MKTIIAGSRTITKLETLDKVIANCNWDITEVVSGAARGVDQLGETWAALNQIPCRRFPADWDTHGKAAGPIRNSEMAEYAEACIILWDGSSKGSKDMLNKANAKKLKVYLALIDK
jgi:hypothetical protein